MPIQKCRKTEVDVQAVLASVSPQARLMRLKPIANMARFFNHKGKMKEDFVRRLTESLDVELAIYKSNR